MPLLGGQAAHMLLVLLGGQAAERATLLHGGQAAERAGALPGGQVGKRATLLPKTPVVQREVGPTGVAQTVHPVVGAAETALPTGFAAGAWAA